MSVRPEYLEDASGFRGHAERLCAPAGEDEVLAVLREASRQAVPVTVSGAGTGLAGGRVPQGGWVLSLEKLSRIEIRPGSALAGAGAILKDLQAAAARTGQLYAPDPTEDTASLGGTIAANASGSRSFLYGDTRRHVLALRVALMDGSVLAVRRGEAVDFDLPALPVPGSTKHSAGFRLAPGMDWVDLFAGSEGTLGVILEAELRLLPQPAGLFTGVVFFPSGEGVLDAVDAWRGVAGLRMIEYLDRASLDLLRPKYAEIPRGAGGALLFEQDLDDAGEEEMERWDQRLESAGALVEGSWFAASAQDRERFRRFRHALPETVNDLVRRNGFLKLGSDYAVPPERNREMLTFYRRLLEAEFAGRYVIFGHIGDAHVHVNILPASDGEFERGRELMLEFARQAVALGGTVGAEHGLGKRKAALLALQYRPGEIEAMKRVKRRLDPQWLLGRGTLFPFEE
ncbi:MAG: FAD-binding oxidoreductase [Acidobacteria bacterium]|nr:FAD-binding oxidoreductase [Acidobacteriota bacterium]